MKTASRPVAAAIVFTCALSGSVLAQTSGTPADPCRPDPAAPEGSLGSTLAECDGVLKPPATGDGEMVEPAPDAGETPVIPPSAVPQQQSDPEASPGRDTLGDAPKDYSMSAIVDAIAQSSSVAVALEDLPDPDVLVQDVTPMLNASDASVLDASLQEHAAGIEALRRAVSASPALRSALDDNGLTVAGLVAARIEGGRVTLFAR